MILQVNADWRIASDPLQWILQRRQGRGGDGQPRWRDRSYCRSCRALRHYIGEYCGEADPAALAIIESWPERFAGFETGSGAALDEPVSAPANFHETNGQGMGELVYLHPAGQA